MAIISNPPKPTPVIQPKKGAGQGGYKDLTFMELSSLQPELVCVSRLSWRQLRVVRSGKPIAKPTFESV